MPRADEVPDSLAKLVRRQALELSPARFDSDISRLFRVLDRTLAEAQALPAGRIRRAPGRVMASVAVARGRLPATSVGAVARSRTQLAGTRRHGPAGPTRARRWDFVHGRLPARGGSKPSVHLSVYLHLGRLQAEVDQHIADRVAAVWSAACRFQRGGPGEVAEGHPVVGQARSPGIGFDPPVQEVRWLEDLQQVDFRLQALPHTAGRAVLGAVEAYVGPLLVAQVPLSIRVRGVSDRQERVEGVAALRSDCSEASSPPTRTRTTRS